MRERRWLILLIMVLGLLCSVSSSYAHTAANNHSSLLHWEITTEGAFAAPFSSRVPPHPEAAIGLEALLQISPMLLWRLSVGIVVLFDERTTVGTTIFTSLEFPIHHYCLLGWGASLTTFITPTTGLEGGMGPLVRFKLEESPGAGLKSIGMFFSIARDQMDKSDRLIESMSGPPGNWWANLAVQLSWGL